MSRNSGISFEYSAPPRLAGVNLANSIGVGMGTANYARYLDDPRNLTVTDGQLPDVFTSRTKLNGQPNFNNINYLALNDSLFSRFQKKLLSAPVGESGGLVRGKPGDLLQAFQHIQQ